MQISPKNCSSNRSKISKRSSSRTEQRSGKFKKKETAHHHGVSAQEMNSVNRKWNSCKM